tara:strand:- start:232 stop:588 length:357 start_codon:yes stop_codon:yes gene_type:complete
MSLKVTEKALAKIKLLIESSEDPDNMHLFIGLKGGGCSGFKYDFDLGPTPESPDDYKVTPLEGFNLYCDNKSYIFLHGTEIDYEETVMSSGFTFNTPFASRSCGCGESVSFNMENSDG